MNRTLRFFDSKSHSSRSNIFISFLCVGTHAFAWILDGFESVIVLNAHANRMLFANADVM